MYLLKSTSTILRYEGQFAKFLFMFLILLLKKFSCLYFVMAVLYSKSSISISCLIEANSFMRLPNSLSSSSLCLSNLMKEFASMRQEMLSNTTQP